MTKCPHGMNRPHDFCTQCERRDKFAAAALTGFAACPECHKNVQYDATKYAKSAVEFADALIAELDKVQP